MIQGERRKGGREERRGGDKEGAKLPVRFSCGGWAGVVGGSEGIVGGSEGMVGGSEGVVGWSEGVFLTGETGTEALSVTCCSSGCIFTSVFVPILFILFFNLFSSN